MFRRGAASFTNHSPKPNAIFHVRDDIVWIKLKEDVVQGAEILVNYGKTYWKQHDTS